MSTARRRQLGRTTTGVRDAPAAFARYTAGNLVGDKYRLVELRGQGGMGVVWVAHDHVLDVPVALKLLDLDQQQDAKALGRRLLEEARAAARLGHASIVRVHDFGLTRQGDPFLVMELLEGEDLAALLERERRLTPTHAVQILLPIVHALAAAHDKGIIHRDVKPENIFLTRDGSGILPKLLDFGIARTMDRPTKLTLDGSILGTPDYMSPEQARGESAEAPTDQWSLCVVLYELITGSCPFHGDNYNALLCSIIEDPVAPRLGAAFGGAELWRIIMRGLEKTSQNRFPATLDLGRALAAWLLEQGVREDVSGTSIRRRWFPELGNGSDASIMTRLAELEASEAALSGLSPHSPASKRHHAGGARGAGNGGMASSPRASEASINSEDDLAAIAELNRGGDPVELFMQAERRRGLIAAFIVTVALILGIVGLLMQMGALS